MFHVASREPRLSALCARSQKRAFSEARDEIGESRRASANANILVSAGDAACQYERRNGHCKLSGKYPHQSFVSFAVDRCRGNAHLKSTGAHACEAFRRRARTYAQMEQ
jgi:hypothetical protein